MENKKSHKEILQDYKQTLRVGPFILALVLS